MPIGIIKLGKAVIEVVDPTGGFLDQVMRVWNSLPSHAQDALIKLWTRMGRGGQTWTNKFSIGDYPMDGCTVLCGRRVNFSKKILMEKDAQYIRELIAHEFGHVHDYSVGPSSMIDIDQASPHYVNIVMEEYAIGRAAEWGYGLPGGRTRQEHLAIYQVRADAEEKHRQALRG